MPAFDKISHVSFSARDAEASASWWTELLGLVVIDRVHGPNWRGIVLLHPPTATVIEFQQHDENQGERFDPRRTGFDHMGLKVSDRATLEEWTSHFEHLGVDYTPIVDREYGSVLTFRDPDGIQFEMFYRQDHP